jgi:hypothetical protein
MRIVMRITAGQLCEAENNLGFWGGESSLKTRKTLWSARVKKLERRRA